MKKYPPDATVCEFGHSIFGNLNPRGHCRKCHNESCAAWRRDHDVRAREIRSEWARKRRAERLAMPLTCAWLAAPLK